MIGRFARKNGIDLSQYLGAPYRSFNDFFSRPIRPELRPIAEGRDELISPCDGLLTAYEIADGTVFPVKQSAYGVSELLGGDAAAQRFRGGLCLVFRLCVDNYHRYCFFDSGRRLGGAFIPGKLHTVRPIALAELPVFARNAREYTLMETDNFGLAAQIEVGALLVGKIENHPGRDKFLRGDEKGLFRFGGSSIVLLLEKDRVKLADEFLTAGSEVPVKMGQTIGKAI
jgi:phosphatidylserine decarboxylase